MRRFADTVLDPTGDEDRAGGHARRNERAVSIKRQGSVKVDEGRLQKSLKDQKNVS